MCSMLPISSDSDANAGTQAEVWHQSWDDYHNMKHMQAEWHVIYVAYFVRL